ncbi:Acyl-CoA reductase [Fontimonas thermophila]|uniref:Acyl-CoA reductase n=1 Tax=Fontimonas thermophila TaxID=1076937 RepID=A0A1I2J642_9GAMM|nr:aldehyde dehydrogenase family protein [Fontimonas thermophila]SFF49313.1 Acyl-CoA reductase [Fontimonas thermophila]
MLKPSYPLYLAGQPLETGRRLPVTDKYSGAIATEVALADRTLVEQAIAHAAAATRPMAELPAYARQAVLEHCVQRFQQRADELAMALCIEAGKPIRDARGEVTRLIDTFKYAAGEAVRLTGDYLPLDISARAHGYWSVIQRVPVGPCAFISPFNFPLNLAAHKIAPAIAAGCPFVLKPASSTPVGALLIGEILAETALPAGAFSILPCAPADAEPMIRDARIKLLSFTGSPAVGWDIKARAGHKQVILELGGNAACIVDADADLDDAVQRLIFGAFYQSGQSCISVQRILAHRSIYAALRERLVAATRSLVCGDPRDERTFVGPLIAEREAIRLAEWIEAAIARGARLLCGGERHGALMTPALLENVPRDCELYACEAFGPVALLAPFDDFEAALDEVNDSRYGLQAGVFTRDLHKARRAWNRLEVGGVVIGDVPSFRVDHMPYGGVKESGLGREGVAWAIEHLTEPRIMVVRTPPR